MIAPLLESKETDPAVVVMDDAGKFAISLLSGHLGGANELSERCAFATGARAVVTTATDSNNLPSFDLLAQEQGWVIDDISRVKTLNTLLLDEEEIAVVDRGGQTRTWLHGRGSRITFYDTFTEAVSSGASGFLFVTNRQLPPQTCPENLLILRPRNLALGIGCNRGTPVDEIEGLVRFHFKRLFLSPKSICCIATVAAKRDEVGLVECARRLGVPLRSFESDELCHISFPSPPSEHALAAVGVAAVAEPAAILASGGGQLLLKKVKSANVTLAVAEVCLHNQ
jgi:cobalt-precorrin 5A hydrolase